MPHLDRFAMSELASESEPLQDFSEEQGARLSAERAMRQRDVREARAGGRGVRRPGALQPDEGDGAPLTPRMQRVRCAMRSALPPALRARSACAGRSRP
jgi:hypothetical protein